jgi:hypothetical protein
MGVGTLWDTTDHHIILGQQVPKHILVQASGHCWTPSSPNPLPSTPKLMARQRSSTEWSCISCACTTPNIHAHGMRVSPMFNTTTIDPFIARPTTVPFRWGWDFNHWVPLMSHYPLHPHRKNHPMLNLRLTKPPSLLNGFNTSDNRSMIFYRNPMLSTNNAMINTGCHTSFRWETRSGCICRKSTLQDPIRSLSTSLWTLHHHQGCGWQWFWAKYSPLPWPAPSVQCGPPSTILPTIIGHIRDRRAVDTDRAQPWLHGTWNHWSYQGHSD